MRPEDPLGHHDSPVGNSDEGRTGKDSGSPGSRGHRDSLTALRRHLHDRSRVNLWGEGVTVE